MLDYFDEVFKDRDSPEIERVGVPFPTLAWSEAAVLYKQTQPNTRLAVGLPMYTTVPTYLDDYRSLPTIVSEMSRLVDRLLEASRDKPSELTDGPDDTMPALVPEPATNPAGPSLIDTLRALNTPTGPRRGRGGARGRGGLARGGGLPRNAGQHGCGPHPFVPCHGRK